MTKPMSKSKVASPNRKPDPFGLPPRPKPFEAVRTGFDGVETHVVVRESARSYNFEVVAKETCAQLAVLTPREAVALKRDGALIIGRSRYAYVPCVTQRALAQVSP